MRKLFREFLGENLIHNTLKEEYNYNFSNKDSKENFLLEYRKFLGMCDSFFYNEERLVSIFNSNEVRLNKKIIEHLLKLYAFAKENDMDNEKIILIEFLYTYYTSINSSSYKNNYEAFRESRKELKKVITDHSLQMEFFTKVIDEIYDFYKQLINYGIKNDIYIDSEIINRIFNNLSTKESYYNELINIFVDEKKNLHNIIKFDQEKNKHIKVYVEYIHDSLDTFGGYNYAKEMFFELDRDCVLTDDICKEIINKYVNITNGLCNKLKDKQYSFIRGISEIDGLKKELNYILRNIKSLSEIQKNKVRECLVQLLRLKRYVISDDDYVKSEMHHLVNEQTIENKKIDKCREVMIKNEFAIYANSKMDFTNVTETALEFYSEYPIQSLVSYFQIDSKKQIYSNGVEKRRKAENDYFKKYFDEKGDEYTRQHPNLNNKLFKNYYEEVLRYLSKTFIMQQELILLILGEQEFRKIINKLKKNMGYEYNNDYAIVVSNVLAIEQNISQIIEEMGLQNSKQGFENINILFDKFKDDEESLNGLMYLNYVLYEKSGMNLRNNIMHGNLINTDLSIPLLVSFSGLIFVSWFRNAKK